MDWSSYEDVRGYGYGLMLACEAVHRNLDHQQRMVLPDLKFFKGVEEQTGRAVDWERVCEGYLEALRERNGAVTELTLLLQDLEEFVRSTEERERVLHREKFPEDYEEEC